MVKGASVRLVELHRHLREAIGAFAALRRVKECPFATSAHGLYFIAYLWW